MAYSDDVEKRQYLGDVSMSPATLRDLATRIEEEWSETEFSEDSDDCERVELPVELLIYDDGSQAFVFHFEVMT